MLYMVCRKASGKRPVAIETRLRRWIPACAGMTGETGNRQKRISRRKKRHPSGVFCGHPEGGPIADRHPTKLVAIGKKFYVEKAGEFNYSLVPVSLRFKRLFCGGIAKW